MYSFHNKKQCVQLIITFTTIYVCSDMKNLNLKNENSEETSKKINEYINNQLKKLSRN